MEYEGLGARCTLPSCRTLDYLPFTCATCSEQFCQNHHLPDAHNCSKSPTRTIPTCPLCNAPVSIPPNTDPNTAVSRHIDAGCPKRKRSNPVCAHVGCNKRDVAATACASCRLVFCLTHRIEASHDCKAPRGGGAESIMGKRLAAVGARHESSGKESKAVKKSIKAGFKNARSNPIGDNNIDPEDAMIVALFFAPPLQVQPRFMRISQRSSAGKILDAVSKHVPDLPAHKGGRYYLYSVKRGGGVNLLPHITPLRDVRMLIGEAFVVGMDDGGLDAHVVAQVGGALGVTSGASASSSLRKKKWLSRGRSSEGKDRCAVS